MYCNDFRLREFVRKYIPTGWRFPIEGTQLMPLNIEYYKSENAPWYIKEAVKAFEKELT